MLLQVYAKRTLFWVPLIASLHDFDALLLKNWGYPYLQKHVWWNDFIQKLFELSLELSFDIQVDGFFSILRSSLAHQTRSSDFYSSIANPPTIAMTDREALALAVFSLVHFSLPCLAMTNPPLRQVQGEVDAAWYICPLPTIIVEGGGLNSWEWLENFWKIINWEGEESMNQYFVLQNIRHNIDGVMVSTAFENPKCRTFKGFLTFLQDFGKTDRL